MSFIKALPAALVLAGLATAAVADETPKTAVVWGGVDGVKSTSTIYSGLLVSVGHELGTSGFVISADGTHTDYKYDNGGTVRGEAWQGSVMAGYTLAGSAVDVTGLIGVDFQDVDLRPNDPAARANGSETGFRIAGDVQKHRAANSMFFGVAGSYSTAFETYWSRARLGYDFGRLAVGVEGLAMGNVDYKAQRLGGFAILTIDLPRAPVDLVFSAGHQFENDNGGLVGRGGGSGTYWTTGVAIAF